MLRYRISDDIYGKNICFVAFQQVPSRYGLMNRNVLQNHFMHLGKSSHQFVMVSYSSSCMPWQINSTIQRITLHGGPFFFISLVRFTSICEITVFTVQDDQQKGRQKKN